MNAGTTFDVAAAGALLVREARLLDERRFDDWLAMFDDPARYFIPIDDDDDPQEPTIVDDDRPRLAERIFRLNNTRAYAQFPPSQTIHCVSNVEVDPAARGELIVRSNLIVVELRAGDDAQLGLGKQRVFAARCVHRVAHDPPYPIREKKVVLLNRRSPLYNLTFLL